MQIVNSERRVWERLEKQCMNREHKGGCGEGTQERTGETVDERSGEFRAGDREEN